MSDDLCRAFDACISLREEADALHAREKYLRACQRLRGLGEAVRVDPVTNGGVVVAHRLVTKHAVPADTPLTAFPPDGVIVGARRRADGRDAAYGPLAGRATSEEMAVLAAYAVPVAGFPPLTAVVADFAPPPPPGAVEPEPPRPDLAAHWTTDVHDSNPFEGLKKDGPGAIRTLAQVALAYMRKVQLEANVRVAAAPGRPTVVLSVRDIDEGEVLKTGRPPVFLLGGDVATTELVVAEILRNQRADDGLAPDARLSADTLRAMAGLGPR